MSSLFFVSHSIFRTLPFCDLLSEHHVFVFDAGIGEGARCRKIRDLHAKFFMCALGGAKSTLMVLEPVLRHLPCSLLRPFGIIVGDGRHQTFSFLKSPLNKGSECFVNFDRPNGFSYRRISTMTQGNNGVQISSNLTKIWTPLFELRDPVRLAQCFQKRSIL